MKKSIVALILTAAFCGNASANHSELTKMCLAVNGSAPEVWQVKQWQQQLSQGFTMQQIMDSLMPNTGLSNRQFIVMIYQKILNRTPGLSEINYWDSKQAQGLHHSALIMPIINDTLKLKDGAPGKAYLKNRLDAAVYAVDVQRDRDVAITGDLLHSVENKVNANPGTVKPAKDRINALFVVPAASTGPTPPRACIGGWVSPFRTADGLYADRTGNPVSKVYCMTGFNSQEEVDAAGCVCSDEWIRQ